MADYFWEGEKVRLRAWEPDDWQLVRPWTRDSEGQRISYYLPFPVSDALLAKDAEERSLKRGDDDQFQFIIETLDGRAVGTLNSHACDRRHGTFSYGIGIGQAEDRRQAYATEAILILLSYFFGELGYQKCNAVVYDFNEPSRLLHEKLGFQLEGRLRRMEYSGGAHHDHLCFGMTREEFRERWMA